MKAYKILALNSITKERVIQQFLDGQEIVEQSQAEQASRDFADRMTERSGVQWIGQVELYETR
jgi:hypothetical protein